MPFKPLVTAGIESLLNTFLYRSPALKTARSRLLGKVLRVEVKGFSTSLILVFSERQVDVLGEYRCVLQRIRKHWRKSRKSQKTLLNWNKNGLW